MTQLQLEWSATVRGRYPEGQLISPRHRPVFPCLPHALLRAKECLLYRREKMQRERGWCGASCAFACTVHGVLYILCTVLYRPVLFCTILS